MSNNRNRNRNRRPQDSERPAQGPEDKPFVFKSKTGTTIRIPAGTPYIPSARAVSKLAAALESEEETSEIAALAATFDMIVSGFPKEVADKIDLALDELQSFTTAYQRFTGTSIPK